MKTIIWILIIGILAILMFKAAEYDYTQKSKDIDALKKAADDAAAELQRAIRQAAINMNQNLYTGQTSDPNNQYLIPD